MGEGDEVSGEVACSVAVVLGVEGVVVMLEVEVVFLLMVVVLVVLVATEVVVAVLLVMVVVGGGAVVVSLDHITYAKGVRVEGSDTPNGYNRFVLIKNIKMLIIFCMLENTKK